MDLPLSGFFGLPSVGCQLCMRGRCKEDLGRRGGSYHPPVSYQPVAVCCPTPLHVLRHSVGAKYASLLEPGNTVPASIIIAYTAWSDGAFRGATILAIIERLRCKEMLISVNPQRHSHLRRRSTTGPRNMRIGSWTAVRALDDDRAARSV
jgi:hypothetical protein